VTRAQRTVIGICERIPELGARFYERGPKIGHEKLMGFLERAVENREMAIDNFELAAYQLTDLCLSGYYRQRLFGYRTEAPTPDEIRATVTAGVDVFLRAYAAKPSAQPNPRQAETA
jgi:transcriptional repressor AefR-like protein